MKHMKRILALALCLCMLLGMAPMAALAEDGEFLPEFEIAQEEIWPEEEPFEFEIVVEDEPAETEAEEVLPPETEAAETVPVETEAAEIIEEAVEETVTEAAEEALEETEPVIGGSPNDLVPLSAGWKPPVSMLADNVPTQAQAYSAMIALKDTMPEGYPLTNESFFYQWNGGVFSGGYGCAGFAFKLSDAAFGGLPARKVTPVTISSVHVGDILRVNNDTHMVIIMEVYSDHVVLAEGNYNSSVHWGRTMTAAEVAASDYMLTRYPVGNFSSTTYTVTYNANGGTGAPSSQIKAQGEALTISSAMPTRLFYNFLGWSTSATATTATYRAGGSFTVDADTTLYAVWEKATYSNMQLGSNTFTVTSNGGTAEMQFTPAETGTYIMESTSTKDTLATIYQADGTAFAEDDDSGSNHNFRLSAKLVAGETYILSVKFYSTYDTGDIPVTLSKLDTSNVPVVKIVSLVNNNDGIAVTWEVLSGYQNYRLLIQAGGSWSLLGDLNSSNCFLEIMSKRAACTVTGLSSGSRYAFRVLPIDADGNTPAPETAEAKSIMRLEAPVLSPIEVKNGELHLSWSEVPGATGYVIYLEGSDDWEMLGTAEGSTSYTVDNLTAGSKYSFYVVAQCGEDLSTCSNIVSVTYNPDTTGLLDTPVLTGVVKNGNKVTVTWNAVPGAEYYRVFYRRGSSGTWLNRATTAETSAVITDLPEGETYTFTVRCMNENGEYTSDFDPTGMSISIPYSLATPVLKNTSLTTDGAVVRWNAVSGAVRYCVLYKAVDALDWISMETTATEYYMTGLEDGQEYVVTVCCVDKNGVNHTSDFDREGLHFVYTAPVVQNFALRNEEEGVMLTWDELSGYDTYRIFMQQNKGSWVCLGDISGDYCIASPLNSGVLYAFRVLPVDSRSVNPSPDTAETQSIIWLEPPVLSPVERGEGKMQLSWTAVPGAASYHVKQFVNDTWQIIATTVDTGFTMMNPAEGTRYTFTVSADVARDDVQTSANSNIEAIEYYNVPADAAAFGPCGDNAVWYLDSNGTMTIRGTGSIHKVYAWTDGTVDAITKIIVQDGITELEYDTFQNITTLESVTLPDSVTTLGTFSFLSCTALADVTLPQHLTVLPKGCFALCTSLEEIALPASLRTVAPYCFQGSGLTSITIPNGVTVLGESAFHNCDNLAYVSIPDSVTDIGAYCFYRCAGLGEITLPASLKALGASAFRDCTGLTKITLPAGVTYVGEECFYSCRGIENIYFLGNAPVVEDNAFRNVTANVRVDPAASGWANLIGSQFGGSLTWATDRAGGNLGQNQSWTLDYSGNLVISGTGATPNYASAAEQPWADYRNEITSVTIESGISGLGSYLFAGCTRLSSVTFAGSAPAISSNAFTSVNATVNYYGFLSGWDTAANQSYGGNLGWKSGMLDAPVLVSVANAANGVTVSWNAVELAPAYRVLYKVPGGAWMNGPLVSTTGTTVTGLQSGQTYYFSVRCASADGKTFASDYNTTGLRIVYTSTNLETPVITSVSNAKSGVTVKWNAVPGAAQYRVFYKTDTSWKTVANTTATSATITGLTSGTTYTFTVRCLSADGKSYTSSYNSTGKSITYIAAPVISSLTNAANGVTVKWDAVPGAVNYRVFYKTATATGWTGFGNTTGTSLTVTGLTSGAQYAFTVRCVSADGKTFTSSYDNTGKSTTYISTQLATPVISSVANAVNGVTVKWGAVSGAAQYRVFIKNGTGWKTMANTTATSATITGLTSGTNYTFTVRCLSADGKTYTSSFDSTGKSITYIAAPVISSLTNAANGVTVKWDAVPGAVNYRVFYKTATATGWTGFGNTTGTGATVTGLTSGTKYSFTVRCVSADGKTFTSSYDNTGKSTTYTSSQLATPVISSVSNAVNGVTVKWGAVSGAAQYRVFYKTDTSWKTVANTTATSATITGLQSGTKYTFTVRCLSADGKTYTSAYDSTGKSITYVAAPTLVSVAKSGTTGVTVKWNAVPGATNYRVFYKTGSGSWTTAGNTTGTAFTVNSLNVGTKYTFTVRCLSADGKTYTSAYDTAGLSITR